MSDVAVKLLVLRASNAESTVAFYRSLGLSFVAERHGGGPDHYSSTLGDLVLEIYPSEAVGPVSRGDLADVRLGLAVPDLQAGVDATAATGALISPPADRDGQLVAVAVDPDGRRVELSQQVAERMR